MFNLYKKYILPCLLDRGMRPAAFNKTRAAIVRPAHGVVLEIGFGSGYNLPFYTHVEKLYALEPSAELYAYAQKRVAAATFPVKHLASSAEKIPLETSSVNTVVSTWTLCSIPDLAQALSEVRRVLKPGGQFLFVEHGQSPKTLNAVAQKILTPITRLYAGNCHLDRNIGTYIKDSGLRIEKLEAFPEDGRPLMFSYRGVAVQDSSIEYSG
jgi:ubiquinone/menaquinone biosynthesis C-methylase UbiE